MMPVMPFLIRILDGLIEVLVVLIAVDVIASWIRRSTGIL